MKNLQKQSPREVSDGDFLYVHSIFRTIQGEGPYTGFKSIFVRLSGCNLQCPLCDTDYTGGRGQISFETIRDECLDKALHHGVRLVVITGGEPFRQNISRLCVELVYAGFFVQIESNGKLPIQRYGVIEELVDQGNLTLVVSPKTANIHKDARKLCTTFKYVVSAGEVGVDGLPTKALGNELKAGDILYRPQKRTDCVIYVNPADHHDTAENNRNLLAAKRAVEDFDDPRRVLGLQLHKIYGIE